MRHYVHCNQGGDFRLTGKYDCESHLLYVKEEM